MGQESSSVPGPWGFIACSDLVVDAALSFEQELSTFVTVAIRRLVIGTPSPANGSSSCLSTAIRPGPKILAMLSSA
jgi:hypothetical protein